MARVWVCGVLAGGGMSGLAFPHRPSFLFSRLLTTWVGQWGVRPVGGGCTRGGGQLCPLRGADDVQPPLARGKYTAPI